MRYLGKISDPKDLATKEYVDNVSSSGSVIAGLSAGFVKANGTGGVSSVTTIPVANGGTGATTAADARTNLNALSNANGAVATANLAAKAVTAAKIADATITATQLASNSVTTAKIAADAVNADKIANSAIGSAAIAAKAVTAEKIGSDVTYSTIGLTSNQVRKIYIGTSTPSASTGSNGDIYIKYST